MEVSIQLQAPAALDPVKQPPVPIGQEAEWAGPDNMENCSASLVQLKPGSITTGEFSCR
jgi:hypothetical protein